VAYEVARQLKAQGHDVGLVALIDTFRKKLPPSRRTSLYKKFQIYESRITFHAQKVLFGPARLGYLRTTAKTLRRKIHTFLYRRRYRQYERDTRNTNWLATRNHEPGRFDGMVVLFRCNVRSAEDHEDYSMGWKDIVRGSLHIVEVPGDHNTTMTKPNVGVLARELVGYLAKGLAMASARSEGADLRGKNPLKKSVGI
jgi:thioesterase domain-containing protein